MVIKQFKIIYAPDVREHLLAIPHKFYTLVKLAIEEQLLYEPNIKTKNRKPLQFASQYGEWELRCGPRNRFRVIYKFSIDESKVFIGAIAEKRGNRIFVGGEEAKL